MPVHTKLSIQGYRVTEDSGIQIDDKQVFATRTQTVVFRGSLEQLFKKFQFGKATQVPESQTKMFCAGPTGARQIAGTDSNPHWEATITWIGLHAYVHGGADYVFQVTPLWSSRQTSLPVEYPNSLGGTSVFRAGGTPYLPPGVDGYHPCVIHDHLPGKHVAGVMFSDAEPYPSHPHILALTSTFLAPNSADIVDYAANDNAGYNWCPGMLTSTEGGANAGVGKWFPGNIQASRILRPLDGTTTNKLWQIEFDVTWLQRKLPV